MRPSTRERLLGKVAISKSGCWEWVGSKYPTGYGVFSSKSRTLKAHRASYAEFVGPIPTGMLVCHRCDNPGCVNPAHLFLGAAADNMADKVSKGRSVRGERCNTAKLTERKAKLVKEFLRRHKPIRGQHGGPCEFLARWLGVTQPAISAIHAAKNWAWVS